MTDKKKDLKPTRPSFVFDGGKKAKSERKSATLQTTPKDRTKARRDPKAAFKKRKRNK